MTYDQQYDFNTADEQRWGDLIPDGATVPLLMTVRPGQAGDGGWLKTNKAGDKLMLDLEFTVTDGPFAKRKFWQYLVVTGSQDAANISRSTLRAILESARNIDPNDTSDAAKRKRLVGGYGDFDGLVFVGKAGIEPGKDGYQDKNRLKNVVTPNMPNYKAPQQMANAPAAPSANPPSWGAGTQKPQQQSGAPTPAWAQ